MWYVSVPYYLISLVYFGLSSSKKWTYLQLTCRRSQRCVDCGYCLWLLFVISLSPIECLRFRVFFKNDFQSRLLQSRFSEKNLKRHHRKRVRPSLSVYHCLKRPFMHNVFSQTHLRLHFLDSQHLADITLVIACHHLAIAVGDATRFSQINSRKLINNSVSPFRLLTFRPISDNCL